MIKQLLCVTFSFNVPQLAVALKVVFDFFAGPALGEA